MKSDHVPVPRYRRRSGAVLFSGGFRPFFLLAGLWAATALGLFVAQLNDIIAPSAYLDLITWHSHEMLFGFVAATLTGFLLTAIPNWTGHLPLQGGGLMALVALWLGGRMAMVMPDAIPPSAVALIDMAFLVAVLGVTLREIVSGKNWRNLPIIAAVALFATGNGLIHAEALGLLAADSPMTGVGIRLSLAIIIALITLVGGRIVPSFTRNWLKKQGHTSLPASFGSMDSFALISTVLGLGLWVVMPDALATASLLLLAGLTNLGRLTRWYGWRTGSEALVWVLHLGYIWIPIGLLLLGLSQLWPDLPPSGALHALTVGAVGTMTLAVMSRATLGHTGRPLHAGEGLTAVYGLVSLAAGARILAAVWDGAAQVLLWIAAGSWIAAFAGFLVICGPMLVMRKPTSATQ